MALPLSLIILVTSLYTLGSATPYLDFGLGLSRNAASSGTRINEQHSNGLSLTRQSPKYNPISAVNAEEDELLDIVLLATVDGKFHALNRTDGTILWSMHNSFTTDCAVGEQEKSLSPLVRTQHMLHASEPDGEPDEDDKIYIVEPQSGSIYVLPSHATHSTPISKLSFTVPQLVEMSPVAFPGDETRMFVGRKETSLIAIDLDTGVVKGVVDTDRECLWEPVLGNQAERDGVDLDELEDNPHASRKREVYVGRTDYTVHIRSRRPARDRKRRRKQRTQTLLYSSYGPNTIHRGIQATYSNSPDGLYVQSLPRGEVVAFDVSKRPPTSHGSQKILKWGNRLDEPVVATFDVLYPHKNTYGDDLDSDATTPYILLQPIPDLSQIFEEYPSAGDREALGYVGVVNDSLYVLGSDEYPLTAFPPRYPSSRQRLPLLEGAEDGTGATGSHHPITDPEDSESGHSAEEDISTITCNTLECLKGFRKWENSSTSGTGAIGGSLEMGGSTFIGPNDSRYSSSISSRETPGRNHNDDSVASSQLWWAKVFATIGALLAGLAVAIVLGARRAVFWDAVTVNRPSPARSLTPVPEIVVSPPPDEDVGEPIEEVPELSSMVIPNGITEKSLPPLPEPIQLEPAHVQEPVRVDVEGPEGGRIPEPDVAVIMTAFIPTADSQESEGDWVMTLRPEQPISDSSEALEVPGEAPTVVSEDLVPVSEQEQEPPTPVPEPEPEPQPPIQSPPSPPQQPQQQVELVPISEPVQETPSPEPVETETGEPLSTTEPADVEDGEANGETEADATQAEAKKKKNRTRSRAKKKKAAFAREVEEREREKEKRAADRVIEKVVMEIEAERRVEPARPVSSLIVSEEVLGFGSHGTMVFKGSFQGRAVAVKRLLNDFVTLASREVTLLQESDAHPNVIRYYFQEARYNFLYIALELCPASLADIVERPDNPNYTEISCNFDPKKALNQISSGLRWLHGLKIVHRDIKPQNILVAQPQSNRNSNGANYRMLISDFGLCKKLGADETSFLPTVHGAGAAGTVGWRAPEILRGEVKIDDSSLGGSDETSQSSRGSTGTVMGSSSSGNRTRLTKLVDIFALGCLFYYTLTSGGHPFGDRYEREVNVLKGAKDLSGLEAFGEEGVEAINLIGKMLADDSSARPDTVTIMLHPFFWNPARRLTFLQDASDRFEIMCRDPREAPLILLEKGAHEVVGIDWHTRLDRTFIDNLGKFRKYQGNSVQDLMRALRNKKHHYQDLPDNVKRNLGPLPDGFLAYFTRRFPRLFLHVYYVVSACGLSHESMFKSYFELQET